MAWLGRRPEPQTEFRMPRADVRCLPFTELGGIASGDVLAITSAVVIEFCAKSGAATYKQGAEDALD